MSALAAITILLTSATGCKSITGGECEEYTIRCHQVEGGVEVVGGIVPDECDCPSNTNFDSMDNVTPGGPYKMCVCK